jgi:hypothetical protein
MFERDPKKPYGHAARSTPEPADEKKVRKNNARLSPPLHHAPLERAAVVFRPRAGRELGHGPEEADRSHVQQNAQGRSTGMGSNQHAPDVQAGADPEGPAQPRKQGNAG